MYGIFVWMLSDAFQLMNKQELAELMKSDKVVNNDYLVVDVRGDDFEGGNIKNCLNQPSGDSFKSNINTLVDRTKDVPLVIFHCALSQQRYVNISISDSLQ
jgi:rhodanese-related sulfurtransferase